MKTDLSVNDILISLSATAPTMPSGYTFKRRIGAMKTNGSAQWIKFVQNGDLFLWDLATALEVSYSVTGTATAKVMNVPSGVKVMARLRGLCQIGAGDSTSFLVFSPSESITSLNPGSDAYCLSYLNNAAAVQQGFVADVLTDTSGQVMVIGGGTTLSSLIRFQAYGWIDPRGKF